MISSQRLEHVRETFVRLAYLTQGLSAARDGLRATMERIAGCELPQADGWTPRYLMLYSKLYIAWGRQQTRRVSS